MAGFLSQAAINSAKSLLHGDGIFSGEKAYCTSDTVFSEAPLNSLQSVQNKQDVIVCATCLRFVGTVNLQLAILAKWKQRCDLANFDGNIPKYFSDDKFLSAICPCAFNCGEIYCSESCMELHWNNSHSLLCTGKISEHEANEHPLILFKVHAISTNEIFLLAADIFAKICIAVENQTELLGKETALSLAMRPYENYVRNLWWEVAISKNSKKQKKLTKTLQALVKDTWKLLSEGLQLKEKGLDNILNEEYLARTIGMFEQNNVGIRLANPVATAITSLTPGNPDVSSMLDVTKTIIASLDEDTCFEDEDEEEDDEMEAEVNQDNDDTVEVKDNEEEEEEEEVGGLKEVTSDPLLNELRQLISQEGLDVLYPPLDGTAFYSTICKMNHSCEPNVIVKYITTASPATVDIPIPSSKNEEHSSNPAFDESKVENSDLRVVRSISISSSSSSVLTSGQAEIAAESGTAVAGDVAGGAGGAAGAAGVAAAGAGVAGGVAGVTAGGLRAVVVAIRDILPGEELLQSYIDQNLPLKERQMALKDYGFVCNCPKCTREKTEA